MESWLPNFNPRPRLQGVFNVLIGIFLMLASYGLLLYASTVFSPCNFSTVPGTCTITAPIPPVELGPLYIFIGIGIVMVVYSLKLIIFGALAVLASGSRLTKTRSPPSEGFQVVEKKEGEAEKAVPPPPPPQPNSPLISTRIEKCSFCGGELPSDATYCPKCFQRRRA